MKLFTAIALTGLSSSSYAFVAGVSVTGGGVGVFGDYADFAAASPAADLRLIFCLTPEWSLHVTGGERFGHIPRKDFTGEKGRYAAYPLSAGVLYRFDFLPIMPYGGAGAAVVLSRDRVPTSDGPLDCRTTRPGVYGEGGMEYYLGVNWGVDARADAVSVWGGERLYYQGELVEGKNYLTAGLALGLFWYP